MLMIFGDARHCAPLPTTRQRTSPPTPAARPGDRSSDPAGGGDDGHAETGEDLRQLVLAAICAQAGTRDALEARDDQLALVVLQRDFDLGLGAFTVDANVADASFVEGRWRSPASAWEAGIATIRLADRDAHS
jgi:hypothetical protein